MFGKSRLYLDLNTWVVDGILQCFRRQKAFQRQDTFRCDLLYGFSRSGQPLDGSDKSVSTYYSNTFFQIRRSTKIWFHISDLVHILSASSFCFLFTMSIPHTSILLIFSKLHHIQIHIYIYTHMHTYMLHISPFAPLPYIATMPLPTIFPILISDSWSRSSLNILPNADASLLSLFSPLLGSFLAFLFLHDKLSGREVLSEVPPFPSI